MSTKNPSQANWVVVVIHPGLAAGFEFFDCPVVVRLLRYIVTFTLCVCLASV